MQRLVRTLIAILLFVTVSKAQTNWIDGQDTSTPDRGRGVSDWQAHYQFAASTGNPDLCAGYIRDRAVALKNQLSRMTYARMYADLTYLIASYGVRSARWQNGLDPSAPADDQHRGWFNWQGHNDYVVKTGGYDTAAKLLFDRMNALKRSLSKEDYARCYADCSILMLNFSRMR